MLFICAVTAGGSCVFPCPFIKLEHTQKHDSFCFHQWWMLKWEFWSDFLGLGIVSHGIFCWMSWHSWLPLQALPITISFFSSAFSLNLKWQDIEIDGFILQRKGINSECMLEYKRLAEEKCSLPVYPSVFQGSKVETEDSLKYLYFFLMSILIYWKNHTLWSPL